MIVVAIIGVLVAVALPSFRKHQNKARQSEAKLAMGGIFASEKAFYAEYQAYISSMDAIGYTPEGARRFYRVGWNGADGPYANTITGYVGAVTTLQYATLNSPYSYSCTFSNALSSISAAGSPFNVDNPQSFIVGAAGNLSNGTTDAECDQWTMDSSKILSNVQVGL